jgi:cyclohexyl-isocyanide hydratase
LNGLLIFKKLKTTMAKSKTLIVGFPLYQGCTLMDFAGAAQVFGSSQGFQPILIADAPITTTEGIIVQPNCSFDNHPTIDILFCPGGGSDGVSKTMEDKAFLKFLNKAAQKATWKGSVCTGAFILAAAGLLKNMKATTYWSQLGNLGMLSAKFNLKIPIGYPRYLIDKKTKMFTGGGISSSVDLALELVMQIKGKKQTQETQLGIQYQPSPPTNAGDPAHAPKALTRAVRKEQDGFTLAMKAAVEKLLLSV